MSLLPLLISAMIGSLVLVPGMSDAYAARDKDGVLVGYLVFTLPGQLLLQRESFCPQFLMRSYSCFPAQRERSGAYGFSEYAARLSNDAREYFLEGVRFLAPLECANISVL